MLDLHGLCVIRFSHKDRELLSRWFIDAKFLCYGVENATSAIPAGVYIATKSYSPRFDNYLYELSNVPERREILIHGGNAADELRGCLAPGLRLAHGRYNLSVLDSQKALQSLYRETRGRPLIITILDNLT